MNIFFTKGKWIWLLCLIAAVFGRSIISEAQQDTVWGLTTGGAANNVGSLFSMNPNGTNVQAAYSFMLGTDYNPVGSVARYNGILYGFTQYGGVNGDGSIFSYNPATTTYTNVYSFDNTHGSIPSGKLTFDVANGLFYGAATSGGANGQGVVFSFDPVSGNYTDVYDFLDDGYSSFTGAYPTGTLTLYNNMLYGIAGNGANGGGVIFSFNPATNTYTDLYDGTDINATQNDPSFAVVGNMLYGIGSNGGTYGDGVLFSFNVATNAYSELVDFNGYGTPPMIYPEGIIAVGSTIYGVTQGYIYSRDQNGQLFSYNTTSGVLTDLYSFPNAGGINPGGNLVQYNGSLLGMTTGGGANGAGTIYSYSPGSNTYTDLVDLSYSSNIGYYPYQCQLLVVHTVGTTPQTIAFSNMAKNYGDAPFDPGAVVSSGLPVIYSSDNPAVATVNGNNQIQIVGAGTANISAFQEGNATYDSITVTHVLTVQPVPLLITAVDTIRNQEQPNPVFRAVYTGLVNGDSAGSLPTQPALTTTAVLASLQGTYPITISGAVDPNYTISYQNASLTVIGLLQSISFIDSASIYGGANISGAATASSGLPVTYTSSNPPIVSITTDQQLQILTAGTTQIIATQAGDADYAPTIDTLQFVVIPAPLSIIADSKSKVYNQPDPVFTATYSGFINGDDTNSLTKHPVFTTTALPGSPPGAYIINVGGAADSNYVITYGSGSYLMTPVQGDQVNSLDAWFSSSTSLQTGIWMTASQPAILQVYSTAGQRLINQSVSLTQGYDMLTLSAAGWASGIYIIRLTGDNLNLTQTIRKTN